MTTTYTSTDKGRSLSERLALENPCDPDNQEQYTEWIQGVYCGIFGDSVEEDRSPAFIEGHQWGCRFQEEWK